MAIVSGVPNFRIFTVIPVGMTSYLKFGYGSDVAIICISRNAQSQVLMKAAVVSLFINV